MKAVYLITIRQRLYSDNQGNVVNMAGIGQQSTSKSIQSKDMTEKQQLAGLVQTVTEIKLGLDNMKRIFESKLGHLRNELIASSSR